jgi:hypothetical protein
MTGAQAGLAPDNVPADILCQEDYLRETCPIPIGEKVGSLHSLNKE